MARNSGQVWSALLVQATLQEAAVCEEVNCLISNNCRCSSTVNPWNSEDPAPQLVAIYIEQALTSQGYDQYWKPLLLDRTNPDGNPVGATFYVSHEYTDYEVVQKLYRKGFEIGSNSITRSIIAHYWQDASLQDLIEKFRGQRQIISNFGNIPIEDVVGVKTPQGLLQGDVSINAYIISGLIYDNSWPTTSETPLFPYTLDYKTTQKCWAPTITCPEEPHPGFWVTPTVCIKGTDGKECSSLISCNIEGTAEEVAAWLIGQVSNIRNLNRAPLILNLGSAWFEFNEVGLEAFALFLDKIANFQDVFLVSVKEVVDWTKNPVSAKDFRTATYERNVTCSPVTCHLLDEFEEEKEMRSCVPCPERYPWKGNPNGDSNKSDGC